MADSIHSMVSSRIVVFRFIVTILVTFLVGRDEVLRSERDHFRLRRKARRSFMSNMRRILSMGDELKPKRR
jgi:hypothetical protein